MHACRQTDRQTGRQAGRQPDRLHIPTVHTDILHHTETHSFGCSQTAQGPDLRRAGLRRGSGAGERATDIINVYYYYYYIYIYIYI